MIYMKILKVLFAVMLAAAVVLSLSASVFAEAPEPSPAPVPTVPSPASDETTDNSVNTAWTPEPSPAPIPVEAEVVESVDNSENVVRDYKAISAAIIIGLAATAGAIAMAMTIMKTIDGIARQPEASGNIRGAMMLGLVFIETAIIYALIVAILVVFVL